MRGFPNGTRWHYSVVSGRCLVPLKACRVVRCRELNEGSEHQNEECGRAGMTSPCRIRAERRKQYSMAVSERIQRSKCAHARFPSVEPTLRQSTDTSGNLKNSFRQTEQSHINVLNLPPDWGDRCQPGALRGDAAMAGSCTSRSGGDRASGPEAMPERFGNNAWAARYCSDALVALMGPACLKGSFPIPINVLQRDWKLSQKKHFDVSDEGLFCWARGARLPPV